MKSNVRTARDELLQAFTTFVDAVVAEAEAPAAKASEADKLAEKWGEAGPAQDSMPDHGQKLQLSGRTDRIRRYSLCAGRAGACAEHCGLPVQRSA